MRLSTVTPTIRPAQAGHAVDVRRQEDHGHGLPQRRLRDGRLDGAGRQALAVQNNGFDALTHAALAPPVVSVAPAIRAGLGQFRGTA